jgi:hypothetical protein
MKEIDLIQATIGWITLSYTAGQWWITVTTALVVATYLAAKHIPAGLFGLVVFLYLLTAVSVLFEFKEYSDLASAYGMRVTEMRIANHDPGATVAPGAVWGLINSWANYVIIAIGTFGAISFSFIHWRKARSA